ncbi:hypothetical protein [Thermithiobacillus plumbiphilus]|uniref:Uncharacterized protein n=1 Tax=Thermithiobacillus plumbiphilus TaxID=1729899 RepID=A0ABU9D7K6_9PROT
MNRTNLLDQPLSARRWLLAPYGDQAVLLPDSPFWQQAIERVRQYLDYLPLSEDVKQDWIIRVLERASAAGEIEPQAVMSRVLDSLRTEMTERQADLASLEADTAWRLQAWLMQGEPGGMDLAAGHTPWQLVAQAPETPGHMPVQELSCSPLGGADGWMSALLARLRGMALRWVTQS